MDIWRVARRWTKNRFVLGLFIFLCLFPLAAGVIAKLTHHNWMLMDIDAVLCAAQGGSPYTINDCPDLAPAAYVYAPQIAHALTPLVDAFGALRLRHVYVALLLLPATTFLLWFALFKAMPRIDDRLRWLALAAVPPMALCCGNLGIVMQAMVIASTLLWPRRLPFIAVILACAIIKPTYLAYLVVFLLEDRPWQARVKTLAPAALAGLALVALTVVTAGPEAETWRRALRAVAVDDQPGYGWLALTSWLGIASASPAGIVLSLGYSLSVLASGLVVARWGGLQPAERLLLGLGLAPLMTPRLMDYDILVLVPFAALMVTQARRQGAVVGRIITAGFVLVLTTGILANIAEYKPWHRTHIAMGLFAALTVAVGAGQLWRRFRRPALRLSATPPRPAPADRAAATAP